MRCSKLSFKLIVTAQTLQKSDQQMVNYKGAQNSQIHKYVNKSITTSYMAFPIKVITLIVWPLLFDKTNNDNDIMM